MTIQPTRKLRIAVLLSGSGTSLENLFEHIDAGLSAEVVCVLSSRKRALGLQRAEKRGVPASAIPRREYEDVGAFNDALHKTLERFDQQLERMRAIGERMERVDLHVRTATLLGPLLKLRIGDVLRYLIAHTDRHLVQAERAMARVGSPTS